MPKLFGNTILKLDDDLVVVFTVVVSSADSSRLNPGGSNADTSANLILFRMLSAFDSSPLPLSLNLWIFISVFCSDAGGLYPGGRSLLRTSSDTGITSGTIFSSDGGLYPGGRNLLMSFGTGMNADGFFVVDSSLGALYPGGRNLLKLTESRTVAGGLGVVVLTLYPGGKNLSMLSVTVTNLDFVVDLDASSTSSN